jgi:hypothetical protein
MVKLSKLYYVEAAAGGEDDVKMIQAHIRGNLLRIRLRRGMDLVMASDSLVGTKKKMPRGRIAIELYKECYRDFIQKLEDKESFSRVGAVLFVNDLLVYREPWNHERAQKRARLFGTDADEDNSHHALPAPTAHPPAILQQD